MNERGIAAIMLSLMVALFSAFIFLGGLYFFQGLQGSSKEYLITEEKLEISDTLKLLLNSPDLCPKNLKITPAGVSTTPVPFVVGGGYLPVKTSVFRKYLVITSLTATITQNLGPNVWEAIFTVSASPTLQNATPPALPTYDPSPNRVHTVNVTAMFTSNGAGGVTMCGVFPTPQQACANIGLIWNAVQQRCPTCEMMGGTWNVAAGKCTPP